MNREKENEHEAVESDYISAEEWIAIVKKAAALAINSETAEISSLYGPTNDPYSDGLTGRAQEWGKHFFARSPGTDIWVPFRDLPPTVLKALWDRMDRKSPARYARCVSQSDT